MPPPASLHLRMAHVAWQIVLHLALPLILGLFLYRSLREPLYRARLCERFGGGAVAAPGCVWIFAASLGETRAVSPLVQLLLDEGRSVLLTHSSPAGLREGLRLFGHAPDVVHRYVPLDLFWALHRMLRRARPALGLVVESELWPGQLGVARRLAIPMVQVNGNLLDRTIERDSRRLGGVRLELLSQFSAILTKSQVYLARYLRAKVPAARVHIVGELKFDQHIDPLQTALGHRLRQGTWGSAPILLIASSVADEEEALINLVSRITALPCRARIIWAPRSPQRFDAVTSRVAAAGLTHTRRSAIAGPNGTKALPDVQVLIADTLGEMNIWYTMADLVFVGASLVPHGGHNIIEPMALGKPVVMGPSLFGITFPAVEAQAAGAMDSLPDAHTLADRVAHLLSTPADLAEMTGRVAAFNRAHLGAAARSLQVLRAWLPATTQQAPR